MSAIACKLIPKETMDYLLSKYKDKPYVNERFIKAKLGVYIKDTIPPIEELDKYIGEQIKDIDSRFKDARKVPFNSLHGRIDTLVMMDANGEYIITNEEGKEIFKKGTAGRDFILMNYRILQGKAVKVNTEIGQYVVDRERNLIIDTYTRKIYKDSDFTKEFLDSIYKEAEKNNNNKENNTLTEEDIPEVGNVVEIETKKGEKEYDVTYTPKGKNTQTYTIRGNQIFNKEGKEVFSKDSIDRNKIFANLAVQQGRAVVINYKDNKYVVNNKGAIISVTSGKIMQWADNNGDRKNILDIANKAFKSKSNNKAEIKKQENSTTLNFDPNRTSVSYYTGDITPAADTIFVFGSNPEGRHSAGAALVARKKFGAIYGQGEGLQGNAYALPTKDLRIKENNSLRSISPEQITENIKRLYETARQNPNKQFKIAYRNTDKATLNGYTGFEMIDMFLKADSIPANIVFSKEWVDTGKFNLLGKKDDIYDKGSNQFVTLAPYFRSTLTSSNKKEMIEATKYIQKKASKLAEILGLEIIKVEPLSGVYLGNSEISWFYILKNADQQKIDLFASLMGDLSNEYQDSVIAANYVTSRKEVTATELVFKTPEGTTTEHIEKTFKELGINDGSYHFDTNELTITCFSQEETENTIDKLKDKYEYKETNLQNSRYLDNESRRDIYKTWLNSENGEQNRSLYNACSKALAICEAAARYPEEVKETERFKAAKQAAEQWDAEHLIKKQEEKPSVLNSLFNREDIGNSLDPTPTKQEQKKIDEKEELQRITMSDFAKDIPSAAIKNSRINLIVSRFEDYADLWYNDDKEEAENAGEKFTLSKKEWIARNAEEIKEQLEKDFTVQEDIEQLFDKTNTSEEEWNYLMDQVKIIGKHFRELFAEATNFIYVRDDVRLDIVSKKEIKEIGTENEENQKSEDNPNEDSQNDGEKAAEIKQGFSVKAREIDPRDTLSVVSRKMINSLLKRTPDGEIVRDDLGLPQYEDSDHVHIVLLQTVSKLNSPDEFIPAIEKLSKKYGWAKELLSNIQKDILEEQMDINHIARIDSALYTDLASEYLNYWVQIDGNLIKANKSEAEEYLVKEWARVYATSNTYSKNSVYNTNQTFNLDNIKLASKIIDDLNYPVYITSTDDQIKFYKKSLDKISELLKMFGVNISKEELRNIMDSAENTEEAVQTFDTIIDSINGINKSLYEDNSYTNEHGEKIKNLLPQGTNIFENIKAQYKNANSKYWKDLANAIGILPEYTSMASFREAGKSRYSYTKPSYYGKFVNAIKTMKYNELSSYIKENYGKYSQFKDKNGYKNWFLKMLTNSTTWKEFSKNFERKILLAADKVDVQNMSTNQYLISCLNEFIKTDDKQPFEWIPMFILSDSSSYEFYKVPNIGIISKTSGKGIIDFIVDQLTELSMQEWERIQLVYAREKNGLQPIANFDGVRGKKFCYFEVLNRKEIFEDIVNAKTEAERKEIIRSVLEKYFEAKYTNFENEFYTEDKTSIISKDDFRRYYYTYLFWNSQMIQLMMVDPAYFKSTTDFFKRSKGIVSATQRLYTPAMKRRAELERKKFNSEKRRFITLSDIQYKSKVLSEVKKIFNDALDAKRLSKEEYDFLITNWEKKVNVTDGQGFITLDSLKSTLYGMGKWTDEMQKAYKHIKTGTFRFSDIYTMFTVLKPYVFTNIDVDSGIKNDKGEAYGNLKVPVIIKNSEAIMMAIYQEIAGNLGTSKLLKALNKFCVDENIELLQFSSGVKIGNVAPIDLNDSVKEDWSEDSIYEYLDECSKIPNVIKEHNREDWGLITETPEHTRDAEALIGAQAKKIILSNIPDNFTFKYKYDGGSIEINKETFIKLSQFLLSSGYIKGYEDLQKIFKDTKSLSMALLEEMAGNTRYTYEDRLAVSLDENGEFNVPLTDPTQKNRIEQLLNSFIKKKITKQQMSGGACVQISAVGYTDDLSIRYKDKDGKLIPTRKDWMSENKGKTEEDWDNYINNIEGLSVAYYECYMPVYAKKIFIKYIDKNGKLDINKLPNELRKVVGYRIPTEAAYSMQPLYIKGFLPSAMGSSIMLPAEITKIVGSDFDIKLYWCQNKNKLC